MLDKGKVHYYGSEDKVEDDEVEANMLEQNQSSTTGIGGQNHINQFLKLSKVSKAATRVERAGPVIDYSQSQHLTLDEDFATLESIAKRKGQL